MSDIIKIAKAHSNCLVGNAAETRDTILDLLNEIDNLKAANVDLLAALLVAELASEELCQGQDPANECWVTLATIRAAIAKARGQ